MARGCGLVLSGLLCAAAIAGPEAEPQPTPTPSVPAAAAQNVGADDDFIEFLGTDDVDDTAWWEFLKRSAPSQVAPLAPVPPAQDATP